MNQQVAMAPDYAQRSASERVHMHQIFFPAGKIYVTHLMAVVYAVFIQCMVMQFMQVMQNKRLPTGSSRLGLQYWIPTRMCQCV
jgi:hypothetical protein